MLRIGIIGLGGFAASHHQAVQALEATGVCRLICTCDPDANGREAARSQWNWDERGVAAYPDYRVMLAAHGHELDVVTVPTPIPLHAEMHRACVEAGIACYLEKPPTLDPVELEQMIVVDKQAERETQVAFNFIVEKPRQSLKTRLLAGEFGKLRRVAFLGVWPRPESYFIRNGWAGKLLGQDGRLLLDSCIGNAMAHYVHNLLFWAGADELFSFAAPEQVEAEMYRAHDIETFDTCFVRARCENDVELRIGATHAAADHASQNEQVTCERATIHYVTGKGYKIINNDGAVIEQGDTEKGVLLEENFATYFDYVRKEAPRPMTRLIDSRPFVHLNNLAYIAAGSVVNVSDDYVRRSTVEGKSGKIEKYLEIDGVRQTCETFTETGVFPTGQGCAWARSGASIATPDDLGQLPQIARNMKMASG